MELKNVLMNKCIEFFNAVVCNNKDNDYYGKLPRCLIIEYKDAVRRTEHHYKLTLKNRWKYCGDIVSTESLDELDEDNPRSGMYYERARAQFYWDLEREKAFVSITFGPRYARGYSFDILKQDEEYILENEQLEWGS